jgi:tRNA threonylcarbamoyladenosine biosynthesis protein TsaE
MEISIPNLDNINVAAREFVHHIGDRRVFAFYGAMGAGKTTFIKAVCEELGTSDQVTSPTFAIVNNYELRAPSSEDDIQNTPQGLPNDIYHFDFYRIKRLEEAYDMGCEEYFYSGCLCFIEWPEMIEELLPEETVRVTISEQPDGKRTVTVEN